MSKSGSSSQAFANLFVSLYAARYDQRDKNLDSPQTPFGDFIMYHPTRRAFLGQSAAAVGAALALAGKLPALEGNSRKLTSGADQVTLGKTGIKTSLLGLGTGSAGVRHSSNQVRLGQEKFVKLVRHAYDRGITYFDTADQYGSHIFLREAIKGLPREKLFIQTKTRARTPDQAKADIDRFLEELGIEYLDTLLLHCMQTKDWPKDSAP